jgi:hypothetical protein
LRARDEENFLKFDRDLGKTAVAGVRDAPGRLLGRCQRVEAL